VSTDRPVCPTCGQGKICLRRVTRTSWYCAHSGERWHRNLARVKRAAEATARTEAAIERGTTRE
jgi:hypothetical protein